MENTFTAYRLRGELCRWIEEGSYTHALTLNADRELSLTRLSQIFGIFCHKIDRAVLGRNAKRMPADARLKAIAFPEHLTTNAHLHVASDLSHALALYRGDEQQLAKMLRTAWLQSTRGAGSIHVDHFRDCGWAFYMTKGADRPSAPYLLSTQFHPR